MDSQRVRLIAGGIILVVLAAVVLYMWKDSLFSSENRPAPVPNISQPAADGGQPAPTAPPPQRGGRRNAPGN
jgi:hypothetical protein